MQKKGVEGVAILIGHFKPNGRKLTRGFATKQNKTKYFVQFAKLQEGKKPKQGFYHITGNVTLLKHLLMRDCLIATKNQNYIGLHFR